MTIILELGIKMHCLVANVACVYSWLSLWYILPFIFQIYFYTLLLCTAWKLRKEITSTSSLRDYITFYSHKGKQPYLGDMREFEGSRLCRTNSLCLSNLLSKMRLKNSNKCSLCDCNEVEDLCNFLLLCPALEKKKASFKWYLV